MTEAIETMQLLEKEMHNKYKGKDITTYNKKDLLRVIDSLNDIGEELATNLYIAERRIEETERKYATIN